MPHTLRTDRLVLRRPSLRDADGLLDIYGSFDAARATKTWPHPATRDYAAFRLHHWRLEIERGGNIGFVAVKGGAVVGNIGLAHRRGCVWGISFGIAPSVLGQGIATEMIKAVCAHGFAIGRVGMIEAEVFKDNPASFRALLTCGFETIGDIGPGWSTALQTNRPRWGYVLTRERFRR